MRFSLKWALALTAYVAFAAAALSAPNYGFAVTLWSASLLAACYALLTALASTGRRRIIAAGFALTAMMAIGFLVLLMLVRARAPWYAIFVDEAKIGQPLQTIQNYQMVIRQLSANSSAPGYSTNLERLETGYAQALRLHAANAISVMAAGLIGAMLGLLAFRRSRETVSTD